MLALYSSWIVPIFAGVSSGIAAGGFLVTKTEQQIRGFQTSIDPMDKVSAPDAIKIILNTIIHLVLIVGIFLIISLGVLRLSGFSPLTGEARYIFGYSCLAGVGIGKYARFMYWNSRD